VAAHNTYFGETFMENQMNSTKKTSTHVAIVPSMQATANSEGPVTEAELDAAADFLNDITAGTIIYASVVSSTDAELPLAAFTHYRKRLLANCGAPSDPLEAMLIEQLAMVHFGIARLHLLSDKATDSDVSIAYINASARLASEFRRSLLALKEYRSCPAEQPLNGKVAVKPANNGKAVAKPTGNGKAAPKGRGKSSSQASEVSHKSKAPQWAQRGQTLIPAESPVAIAVKETA
jgi:hypothetical protein